MTSISCVYLGHNSSNKQYTFSYNPDLVGLISVDDYVVVEDVNTFSVVQVKELDVTPWGPGERSVIQKVDTERVKAFFAEQLKRKTLMTKLRELEELEKFKVKAENNPAMKTLLTEYYS